MFERGGHLYHVGDDGIPGITLVDRNVDEQEGTSTETLHGQILIFKKLKLYSQQS